MRQAVVRRCERSVVVVLVPALLPITLPQAAEQAYTNWLQPTTGILGAMRELLELQTGQVAFISGLMSGFSISIAAQILRYGIHNRRAQVVFLMFLLCSLLFLLALYVDVRLSILLVGVESVAPEALAQITDVRNIGTASATVATAVFVLAIGSLGWLASNATGVITCVMTAIALYGFWLVWSGINSIGSLLPGV